MGSPTTWSLAMLVAAGCGTSDPPAPSAARVAPASTPDDRGHAGIWADPEGLSRKFDNPARDDWQHPDRVIERLGLRAGMRVADVGAGTGYFATRIVAARPDVTVYASDPEPEMIRYLGDRLRTDGIVGVVPIVATPTDPKLPEHADVALVCNTLMHVEDPVALLANLRAQLVAGGRALVVDWKPDAAAGGPGPTIAMRKPARDVASAAERAGWRVVEIDETSLPHQYVVELATPDG